MAKVLETGALQGRCVDVTVTDVTPYTLPANASREILHIFNKGAGEVTLTFHSATGTTSFPLADQALYEPQNMLGNKIVISTTELTGVDVAIIEK